MHTLELYNELMEHTQEDVHKSAVNKYLEQNSNALAGHLLMDLQTLTEKQGYWNAKGEIEMETNLKEVRDGFQRLQENYTGISTYIAEMDRRGGQATDKPHPASHIFITGQTTLYSSLLWLDIKYRGLKNSSRSVWDYWS